MNENQNKLVNNNRQINQFHSHTKQVAIGFVSILALIVYIMVMWGNNASSHTANLTSLAERQVQTRLLANMLYAAQQRSLHLHQMLDKTDPFELDDEYLQFRQHGEMYLTNREKLLATHLSQNEAAILT